MTEYQPNDLYVELTVAEDVLTLEDIERLAEFVNGSSPNLTESPHIDSVDDLDLEQNDDGDYVLGNPDVEFVLDDDVTDTIESALDNGDYWELDQLNDHDDPKVRSVAEEFTVNPEDI